VPDNTQPLFPLPKPTLKHLLLPAQPKRVDYRGNGRGQRSIREVVRSEHADFLTTQLRSVSDWVQESIPAEDMPDMTGIPVTLTTKPGYPLSPEDIFALTTQQGKKHGPPPVHLHSQQLIDNEGRPYTRVLLSVPFGGLGVLEEKIKKFGTGAGKKGNLPYWANIDTIAPAAIEGLWTDAPEDLPRDADPHWWQFWVRKYPAENRGRFLSIAAALELEIRGDDLVLPDHYVFVARGTYSALASSIPLLDTLAELRAAHSCVLGLTDLKIIEQEDYVTEALQRINFPADNAPAVCLLDTGVNRGHRLLEPLLAAPDADTVFGDSDGSDGYIAQSAHGHGTPMAGLAAYGDLRQLTESSQPWNQLHRLESVRLFDPRRPHDPDNYGSVTLQAVRRPEINHAHRQRVYCLAVTAPATDDGKPSAWSAAVDTAAYGDGNGSKRLILVSSGNVHPDGAGTSYTYPDENRRTPIEDPAQAWNAVTVGALTRRTTVTEGDDEARRLTPIVREKGMLSPFSRTSCEWDPHWPLKPEIVLEGGNAAIHPENHVEYPDSLQLFSTSAMVQAGKPFCSFKATSAATAQAARLAAEITARYPNLWPETVRGLLVHAARWIPPMLDGIDPHRPYTKKKNDRQRFIQTLRSYGYGEPDIDRAYFSAQHATTLIRQDELRPYKREKSSIKLNDCHIHQLPWPKQLLQDNYDATLTLRVTLSYFVAPNPSANNALKGSRYRYGGSLLRFLVRNKDDSDDARFEARMTRIAQEKETSGDDSKEESLPTDPGWALGSKLCGKGGSLIHDVWKGSAADLAQMDRIAIFPAKGWWAYRKFPEGDPWHDCYAFPIRYSLLVSLEAEQDIPLYTEISNLVSVHIDAT
jgi:hypothetical protein